MDSTINFLKAISDKNRLLILYLLHNHTLCVCDIQNVIPLTQGALSIQLRKLTSVGLLESFKQGKWVFYKLSQTIKPFNLSILSELFKTINTDKDVQTMLNQLQITEKCQLL
ncbi:metalloregulator ArsR/SmtB family transcription factor [Thiotrichales bacterium 19S3-7]|nr:metalloregulator ArsR/SmtB family transcription factor [Thiotrichales bacterium 19S3-7]MCF6801794.1 metalloregulator ArsR/SmtB family transcription factor [Thiotrichales bacterium 19S3-11]